MKDLRSIKKVFQNFLLLFVTLALLFTALEIVLRIYKPFDFRVKGNKIILPINKKYSIKNDKTDKLDRNIIHTKNSLGFRGEEPPKAFENNLTIITVGGSTTECFHTSDNKTWTDVLGGKLKGNFRNLWINNAGLDGQSTLGHIVLMEDYINTIKPKVVLFLIGSNDREESARYNKHEKRMMNLEYDSGTFKNAFKQLTYRSEVLGTVLNIYRYVKAYNMGLAHNITDYKSLDYLEIPQSTMRDKIETIKNTNYEQFKERLNKLVQFSRRSGIDPVFVTQPTLVGNAIDDITGVNLAKIIPNNRFKSDNGEIIWEDLERVNDVIREVGKEKDVLVLDLSRKLPKSSRYYYDFLHFSNDGNEKVAQILFDELCIYLEDKYPNYLVTECLIQ